MTAGPWTATNTTRQKILTSQFDIDSDSWKVALFQSTSNLSTSSTSYASLTNEVPNTNGYTTGGNSVTFNLSGTTTVNVSFASNPIWAASGGSIVARYAAIYEVGGDVFAYCLLDNTPADVTVASGSVLMIDSDGTPNPAFSLS